MRQFQAKTIYPTLEIILGTDHEIVEYDEAVDYLINRMTKQSIPN